MFVRHGRSHVVCFAQLGKHPFGKTLSAQFAAMQSQYVVETRRTKAYHNVNPPVPATGPGRQGRGFSL